MQLYYYLPLKSIIKHTLLDTIVIKNVLSLILLLHRFQVLTQGSCNFIRTVTLHCVSSWCFVFLLSCLTVVIEYIMRDISLDFRFLSGHSCLQCRSDTSLSRLPLCIDPLKNRIIRKLGANFFACKIYLQIYTDWQGKRKTDNIEKSVKQLYPFKIYILKNISLSSWLSLLS